MNTLRLFAIVVVGLLLTISVYGQGITEQELNRWFIEHGCVYSGQGVYAGEVYVEEGKPLLRLMTDSPDAASALACRSFVTLGTEGSFRLYYDPEGFGNGIGPWPLTGKVWAVHPPSYGSDLCEEDPVARAVDEGGGEAWYEWSESFECVGETIFDVFFYIYQRENLSGEVIYDLSSFEEFWPELVTTPSEPLPELTEVTLTTYPNPVRNEAATSLTLERSEYVRVSVYDALGREMAVLSEGIKPQGEHKLALQAHGLPAGVYVVRAVGETFVATAKVTITH